MKVLFSVKDLKKILSSLDISRKDMLERELNHIIDSTPEKFFQTHRKVNARYWFSHLTDGSYGQFMFSKNKDTLICSLGETEPRRRRKEEDRDTWNTICIFFYSDKFNEWTLFRHLQITKEDNEKKITALTRKFMKQFSSRIDSWTGVNRLADSIVDSQK